MLSLLLHGKLYFGHHPAAWNYKIVGLLVRMIDYKPKQAQGKDFHINLTKGDCQKIAIGVTDSSGKQLTDNGDFVILAKNWRPAPLRRVRHEPD